MDNILPQRVPFQKNVLLHEHMPPEHDKPFGESHISAALHVSFSFLYKAFLNLF